MASFFLTGIMQFIVPPGLPAPMAWMYDLSPTPHYISGTAEILGGLGLILPGTPRIQTRLVPLAALGLSLVMAGAVVYHFVRNEYQNIAMNAILLAASAFLHMDAGCFDHWKIVALKRRVNIRASYSSIY